MRSRILPCLVAIVAIAGCSFFGPDLSKSVWAELEVDYCVGEGKEVFVRTWRTRDRLILQRLREGYSERNNRLAWTAGYMRTNELRLTLRSGKRWNLYIYAPTNFKLIDPSDSKKSYHVELSPEFHDRLKSIIEKHEGTNIHFYYGHEVKLLRE